MAQIRTRQTAAQVGDAGTITNNDGPLSNAQIDQNFINLNNDIATRLPLSGGTLTGQLTVPANFTVQAQGAEGGEIVLKKGSAQTSLAGDVILDTLGETFRVFENGGTFRQIFFNLTNGNITGSGGISINIDGGAARITNNNIVDYLRITNTAGAQRLLMGNQDSSGVNNPSMIVAANGILEFGNGNTWTAGGGTFTKYAAFSSTAANFTSPLQQNGNQVLHAGNYTNYTINNAGRIKTYYIDSLNAVTTQARRYEIARIGIDFNDWNSVGSFEVELLENYFVSGLKKRYSVNYGYNSINSLTLVEMSGEGSNRFRVAIGSPVQVSGDHYYLPVFVDVRDYSGCSVIIRTNRLITTEVNTAIGYAYINTNPTGSNISDFVPDSTVNMSNSATAWQVGGNTVLHSGNYNSYALPLTGGTLTGELTLNGVNTWFAAASTHLRSNNEFLFLTNSGGAQKARFHGIQVGGSYGGTIPDQGILFGGDTTLTRTASNTLTASGDFFVNSRISNSNYASTTIQPGALSIGRTDTNYSYTGTTWASDVRAGILANCSETWEFVVHDSGDSVHSAFYFDGGARFMLGRDIGWGTSYIEATGSFRSTAFYASDNSSFWWRPGADSATHRFYTPHGSISIGPQNTSHCHITTDLPNIWFNKDLQVDGSYRIYGDTLNRFSQGALVLRGASPTVYLRDTDHMSAQLHVNNNTFYLLRGGVDAEGWTQVNGVWPLEVNLSNNNALFGGTVSTYADFRSNIYYDINDTTYYVDAAGTSKLNILESNIYYQASNITIGYLHAEASASIASGGSNVLGDGVQQDLLAFNPPTTAEVWNGSAWSSISIPNGLFAGRLAQAFGGQFDLTPTLTRARFTWNSFGYRFWHALTAAHTTQGNNIRFTLETSTDGVTWVNHGTSGWTSSWPGYNTWTVKGNNSTSNPRMRITVERDVNNQNNVALGCISLMGSYGGYSKLFDWDFQRNVTFYNNVDAVDFNSTSDVTKKKDVKTIEGALELVMKLRGVTFNWISSDRPSMGLIAQEVEPILPQVVHTGEDGTKTISYGNLVGLLVECVKAQEDRLTRLENLVLHTA